MWVVINIIRYVISMYFTDMSTAMCYRIGGGGGGEGGEEGA